MKLSFKKNSKNNRILFLTYKYFKEIALILPFPARFKLAATMFDNVINQVKRCTYLYDLIPDKRH